MHSAKYRKGEYAHPLDISRGFFNEGLAFFLMKLVTNNLSYLYKNLD